VSAWLATPSRFRRKASNKDQHNAISGRLRPNALGIIPVSIILFLFLGNLRAALIVPLSVPFSLLFAFDLRRSGQSCSESLLSPGALDLGMIVDGTVVIVAPQWDTSISQMSPTDKVELDCYDSIKCKLNFVLPIRHVFFLPR
jgi:AcrB/AcrD/AcrF family